MMKRKNVAFHLAIIAFAVAWLPSLSGQEQDSNQQPTKIERRFEQLREAVQQDKPGAMEELWEVAQFHLNSDDRPTAELAASYTRLILLQRLRDGDRLQASALAAAVLASLQGETVREPMVGFALQAAQGLEKAERYALATQVYARLTQLLDRPIASANIATIFRQSVEAKKRLSLVGQSLEVTGATIQGATVDPNELKNKVVLIDFWASWCAPCRKEIPLIRALLDQYEQQGFTVVGICLDEDAESGLAFLKDDQHVRWPTLFDPDESKHGFDHPLAQQVGVTQLPTAILLNQQGQVVSLAARGENLERWLAVLFDDPKNPEVELEHQPPEK